MQLDLLSTKEFRISEDRMRHMHGVAEYMYKRAKDYKIDAEEMYLLGLLHDIGYIQGFEEGHEKYGARLCFSKLLRDSTDLVYCIEHHHQIPNHFTWNSVLCRQQYLLLEADMVVNSKGEYVGFNRRLKEIGEKHGYDSEQYKNCVNNIKWLKMQRQVVECEKPEEISEKMSKPSGDAQTVAWKCFEHIPMEYRDFALYLFAASDFECFTRQNVKRIVEVSELFQDFIKEELEWGKAEIMRGLASLCEVGYLRPTNKPAVYEINPVFTKKNIYQISDVYANLDNKKMYWPEEETLEEENSNPQYISERYWKLYNKAIDDFLEYLDTLE